VDPLQAGQADIIVAEPVSADIWRYVWIHFQASKMPPGAEARQTDALLAPDLGRSGNHSARYDGASPEIVADA
jgi:hypothetical protein